MGYYTNYSLSVSQTPKVLIDLVQEAKLKDIFERIFDLNSGESHDAYKWYEHDQDMKKLSQFHKDILFTLEGKGEESGDMWINHYLNGKVHKVQARIIFDEFDPAELQEIKEE